MIPGVTFHPRVSWQDPSRPITGPANNLATIDTDVIHYTADDDLVDGDPGESADQLDDYLRAIQRSYLTSRGYSIGYNWAVDWLGGVWELRGFDIRTAANKGHNGHTNTILVLVDGADPATHLAIGAVRAIIAESQRRTGRTHRIVGHGQLSGAATQCPGLGLRVQIAAGLFNPVPPPPTSGDDMRPIITTWTGESWPILIGYDAAKGTYVWRGIPGPQVEALLARGAATDGRGTPWPGGWKSEPWIVRVG